MRTLLKYLPAGTVKRLHVNQHIIKANAKVGAEDRQLVFTVKNKGRTLLAREVNIDGPSRLVYSPDKPLDCGAKVWIETQAGVWLNGAEGDDHAAD